MFGLGVKHFFRRKALPFHLHIMECTCVTTCEADKLLWLEHLSNSYVIKTPDYFIILSHLCIYIIWSLAKLVAPSRNICLLRMCFYCTYNILCMNQGWAPHPAGKGGAQWAKITHFGSSRDSWYFRVSVGIWMSLCWSIWQWNSCYKAKDILNSFCE